MIQAQCSIAVLKIFFSGFLRCLVCCQFSKLTIFFHSLLPCCSQKWHHQCPKLKWNLFFFLQCKTLKFYASLKLCMCDMISRRIKNTPSIKCHWHKDGIGLFLTNLTAYPRLQLVIDIKCFFFSDLVRIGEHSGTCHVIFMFHGL